MHRNGVYSESYIVNMIGFINTKNDSIYQNVEIVTVFYDTGSFSSVTEQVRTVGYTDEVARGHYDANKENPIMGMYPTVLNPKSRGEILLRSKDPKAKPLIYPHYFSDEKGEDLETFLEAIRFVEQLVATEEFRKHEPQLVRFEIPICDGLAFRSDDYWRCAIKQMTSTIYHPVGTCAMGPENDGKAVVDPRLRLYGVKNVRVVDASIMPTIISAHTNAPSMMIGHKAGR
ncbi:hypothetical protein NQ318_002267 [Aromia moschata]|uniref:Glucose-methanol-choline oxidoreductase C-terminal domain-containing protein n=1 Tax=Aromia moschata TaxID=1265417 RepID=A0AAV8Z2X6_9CUCU|nr:hypothetical protein NQ318_002267 [Aromia moschata]